MDEKELELTSGLELGADRRTVLKWLLGGAGAVVAGIAVSDSIAAEGDDDDDDDDIIDPPADDDDDDDDTYPPADDDDDDDDTDPPADDETTTMTTIRQRMTTTTMTTIRQRMTMTTMMMTTTSHIRRRSRNRPRAMMSPRSRRFRTPEPAARAARLAFSA